MYVPPITSGLFMSSFECQLSDEDEVLHKRVSVALSNIRSMHIAE